MLKNKYGYAHGEYQTGYHSNINEIMRMDKDYFYPNMELILHPAWTNSSPGWRHYCLIHTFLRKSVLS